MKTGIEFIPLFLAAYIAIPSIALAEKLRIATWNVKEGSVENLLLRQDNLEAAGKKIRADVLIIQEINSFASAQFMANAMGMNNVDIAVSNFGSDAQIVFFGFETAVISKVPIVKVDEWQQRVFSGKNRIPDTNGSILIRSDGDITIQQTGSDHVLEVPPDVITDPDAREFGVTRGILRVELDNGLVIYPVHLKSNLSRLCGLVGRDIGTALSTLDKIGNTVPSVKLQAEASIQSIRNFTRGGDNENSINRKEKQEALWSFAESYADTAKNRENAAAFIAKKVQADLNNDMTVIVAGDFNTPTDEPSKTGTNLIEDCIPQPWSCSTQKVVNSCGTKDGFDDTLHILTGDVVPGVKLFPLFTKPEATHTKKGFADSPIDNIYIGGPLAQFASEAKKLVGSAEPAFGSDHYPLVTTITVE